MYFLSKNGEITRGRKIRILMSNYGGTAAKGTQGDPKDTPNFYL